MSRDSSRSPVFQENTPSRCWSTSIGSASLEKTATGGLCCSRPATLTNKAFALPVAASARNRVLLSSRSAPFTKDLDSSKNKDRSHRRCRRYRRRCQSLRRMAKPIRPPADAWHPQVLQSSTRFSERRHQFQQYGALFRRPSDPPHQGGHRELGFVAQPLSILTGLTRLLPAGSGSKREDSASDCRWQTG
jgi:hypothetical protein